MTIKVGIKFNFNEGIYLKDPQETELGKNILKHSILLIDSIGFESFTFKKLACEIESSERSIYRYFDNKHKLLLFLSSWYWQWVYYLIELNIRNINDSKSKLKIAIANIVHATSENTLTEYINESVLHKVIIKEGAKTYHVCEVDDDNRDGLFGCYKSLVCRVAELISEVNPNFEYSVSLASNLFEMANNQVYFAEHIPKLSSLKEGENLELSLIEMMNLFVFRIIENKKVDI